MEDILCSWIGRNCEDVYTTQGNLQTQCNPYQNASGIYQELEQVILKFVWKHKELRIVKAVLRKMDKIGGIMLPDFKLYYKAMLIKIVQY